MINYGKHSIDKEDIDAVCDVLQNHFLTQGPKVGAFESALCDYTGASHSIAVNSGTSALHVACLALGVGRGDVVWTVPNSFVASANCALYCGADVDFVDIDAATRNLCVVALKEKLSQAQKLGKLPKALVVVHFAGLSCDMEVIGELATRFGFAIIEDASHALGANYKDKPVGCCQYSDLCVFSFHPVKSITSAEGGAVMANDQKLATAVRAFANHGTTRNVEVFRTLKGAPWEYEQHSLGFNYRLSDLHAVLGLSQIKRLDAFVKRRRQLAQRYHEAFAELPIKLPCSTGLNSSSWHLYVIELQHYNREQVFQSCRDKGIALNVHYIPIHLQPYYREIGFKAGDFPNSEKYYDMALTLPLYPDLTDEEQDSVIAILKEVLV